MESRGRGARILGFGNGGVRRTSGSNEVVVTKYPPLRVKREGDTMDKLLGSGADPALNGMEVLGLERNIGREDEQP